MTAVILLGHGSPDPRYDIELFELCEKVLAASPHLSTVLPAALDHTIYPLNKAAAQIAAAGAKSALVVPLFLSRAFHAKVDVPKAVNAAIAESRIALELTEPVGLIESLLKASLDMCADKAIVLASAGTSDYTARARFNELADVWSERRGRPVTAAYASQAEPTVSDAIHALETQGHEVAVLRAVLFNGVLPDRIQAAAGNRTCTPVLSELPALIDRINELVAPASASRSH